MNVFDKIHVWVGINFDTDEEFEKYFELDDNSEIDDIDSSDYKVCQFCKDIGERWYDEDWIGIYAPVEGRKIVDIDLVLKDLPVESEVFKQVKQRCIEKGYEKANIMFYYHDSGLVIKYPNKLYNKLAYIGVFDL